MKNKRSAIVVLALVALAAALLLGVTNEITKGPIQEQAVRDAESARKRLLPDADLFEEIELPQNASIASCYAGKKDGGPVGYIAQINVSGFSGPIEVTVGSDTVGAITGIEVGGPEFSETAGLGAKAKEDAFKKQFAGLMAPVAIGDPIDAITAATITTNAVVRGVNAAMEDIGEIAGFTIAKDTEGGALGDGRFSATAEGFAGPVYVEVQLDEAGVITEIIVGDERFNETSGFGSKAQEAAFYEQFIGLSGPVELSRDVDAISGATITSKAVVDAANLACLYATDPEAAQATAGTAAGETALPEIPENARRADASAEGFEGPVFVEIALDDADQIAGMRIGDERFSETKGFGAKAQEPEFIIQFIGKTLPVGMDDIDVISGATITTKAVLQAVNEAAGKLIEMPEETGTAPAEDMEEKEAGMESAEGQVFSTSSNGFEGPVFVEITIDMENVIQAIHIGDEDFAETKGLGAKAQEPEFMDQFIGKKLPISIEDIDALSGATITTKAVIEAINAAYAPDEAEESQGEAAEGIVASASALGFEGPVFVEIIVDSEYVIQAICIGDENFAETKGLGAKAQEPEFADQFIGKKLPISIEDIDALSGATITTKAVIEAINAAYAPDEAVDAKENPEEAGEPEESGESETSEEPEETQGDAAEGQEAAEGIVASASALGFEGPVFVEIIVDSEYVIQAIRIGDENFAETKGLGAKAQEPEFMDQFIGKKLPISIEDIDALSGATITTKAVIEAINAAYVPHEHDMSQESQDETAGLDASAAAQRYNNPVPVEVALNSNNVIQSIRIGNENGAEAQDPEFMNQFIGKKLPISIEDIDALSGATITTKEIIAAVNAAYVPHEHETPQESQNETAGQDASAAAQRYNNPVFVEVTLDLNNVIRSIRIGDENYAGPYGAEAQDPEFMNQFIGKKLPISIEDIDTPSGTAIAAKEIIAAVNAAYVPHEHETSQESQNETAGQDANAAAQRYNNPVFVDVALDSNNVIRSIRIADENGAGTQDDELMNQFIGKELPISIEDIDALSGVTITTKEIIAAVNAAYVPHERETSQESQDETAGQDASAAAQRYNNPVFVDVVLDSNNVIRSIRIGDENGAGTQDHELMNQFIGKELPISIEDIDTLSGATVTTKEIIAAVNAAYVPHEHETSKELQGNAAEDQETAQAIVVSATAQGFEGPVFVEIVIDSENQIQHITIGDESFAETKGLGAKAQEPEFMDQFIGKKLPVSIEDIDALSGATITTKAVIEAINAAYQQQPVLE